MIEPTLALQATIGNALAADPAVTAIVEPANIRGGSLRPDAFPCILMGNGHTEFLGHASGSQYVARVSFDLHIWALEDGADTAKTIGFAVMNALKQAPAGAVLISMTSPCRPSCGCATPIRSSLIATAL
ncbi:DUF3168 domain-containing protein [Agrobacterium tumefaciens]|uniref:DUF3168 domain-containing protein n=1 Tax=Agrobacterium tumefaciens TaxID=358 RepID=UPI00122FE0B0|nr:DUF3168 domain-containing protein [Agrobacterium tumefaciens]